MAYQAPLGSYIRLSFSEGPSTYVPPPGDEVSFNHIPNVDVALSVISLGAPTQAVNVLPGPIGLTVNTLSITNTTSTGNVKPGYSSVSVYALPGVLATRQLIVGRSVVLDSVAASLILQSISVSPGAVSVPLSSIGISAAPKDTSSVLVTRLSSLMLPLSSQSFTVLPGPVALTLNSLDTAVELPLIDRVYLPIKGSGPVDMQLYYSKTVDNTDANGGILSQRKVKNTHNSILPHVTEVERLNGSTVYRKVLWRNVDTADANFLNGMVYIDKKHDGDHIITIIPCSYNATQISIAPNAREYGTGVLSAGVAVGSTQFTLTLKDSSLQIFKTGDTIVLSAKNGSEKFSNITVLSQIDTTVTIQTNIPIKNPYIAGTLVSSCVLVDSLSNFSPRVSVLSTLGTHDNQYPVEVYGNGCIAQKWTLDFISSTQYTCTGSLIGTLSTTGDLAHDYTPINPYTGTPYFTLDQRALKGLYQQGDKVIFATNIAVTCIWVKRVTPPNSADTLSTFSCTIQGVT